MTNQELGFLDKVAAMHQAAESQTAGLVAVGGSPL
jgi:hypothetical protein